MKLSMSIKTILWHWEQEQGQDCIVQSQVPLDNNTCGLLNEDVTIWLSYTGIWLKVMAGYLDGVNAKGSVYIGFCGYIVARNN